MSFIMHTYMIYTSYPYYIYSCAYLQQLCEARFNYFNCVCKSWVSEGIYVRTQDVPLTYTHAETGKQIFLTQNPVKYMDI